MHGRPLSAVSILIIVLLGFYGGASEAADYSIYINTIYSSGGDCNFDTAANEEFTWIFELGSTGQTKCFDRQDIDETTTQSVTFQFDFSTTQSTVNLNMDFFEKDGSNFCTREGSDVANHRVTFTKTFTLTSLTDNVAVAWEESRKTASGDCSLGAKGSIKKHPAPASVVVPGAPRISSTSLALVSSELVLTINGAELNPDAGETPVLQITGVETSCIASSYVVTSSRITCRIVQPDSAKVSSLGMQVQVQTTYGVSRLATVAFPTCSPACSGNGTCYWSKDIKGLECVCKSYLNYGAQCQYTYPDGEPILEAVSPIGGDYTKQIVIGVSGRAFPVSDTSITSVICELSWSGSNQRVAPEGDRVVTSRNVVWSGTLLPYDNRPIAHADSLQLKGLCVIPAGTFSQPRPDTKNAMVTLIWQRAATGQSIESRNSRSFLLYGPLDPASCSVQVVTNPADDEMRVFRDQYLRVTMMDADGNNRVGGEDSDLFNLEWFGGPSTEPRLGIRGGVTKSFKYSACRRRPDDNTCAYYEMTQSFDFSGQFKANVFYTAPGTYSLVALNKGNVIFDVKGLGSATLPVPPRQPSGIDWAESLRDREDIDLFDKGLAQLISPNTGARDRSNVLGPLFQRWKGGWFTQRQTVSLSFETGLSRVALGSVHVVRAQGASTPAFCDAHTDELDAGPLSKTMSPWERRGNVPRTFRLTGSGFSDGDCLTSISISIEMSHRNRERVGITLTRTGLPSTNPRAKNVTTSIVLRNVTTLNAPPQASWVVVYTTLTTPELAALKGMPAVADWVLIVDSPVNDGYVRDWSITVETEYCLKSSVVDNSVCGEGGGQFYARAANVDDRVTLECPQGGVIESIVWARFGKLDGSCQQNNVRVYDNCEANQTTVARRVASVCVGHTSCELTALDTQFAEEIGEPYLCPGELPPCPDDVSLLVAEDSSSQQSSRRAEAKREHSSSERALPWTYPGTEDHHYKINYVRHASEPLFRQRRADDAPTCTYSSTRPKKALVVKAMCKDSNAAFTFTDSPVVERKMLVASATADFDNDWKDETVTLFGYIGGALHAAITYTDNSQAMTQTYTNLKINGSAVVVVGQQIEMQTGDFDGDGYPELVFGFAGSGGALKLYLWDLAINRANVWGGQAKPTRANLQSCGCFAAQATILGLFNNALPIRVPTGPVFPVLVGGVAGDSPGFSFSLSAADIALSLRDYLVVSWIVDGSTVAWQLYQQSAAGTLEPASASPSVLRSLNKPHAIAVNLANYEGSGTGELALGVVDDDGVSVFLYAIDQTEEGFPMTQEKVITIYDNSKPTLWGYGSSATPRANLRMVSGDLDDDGDAEIVVGFTALGKAYLYRIDAPGSGTKCRRLDCMELFGAQDYSLSLGYTQPDGVPPRSPELHLAIGNMDDSYANELLVVAEYTSSGDSTVSKVMLVSLIARSNVDGPFSINGRHCYKGPHYQGDEKEQAQVVNNMALAVGNLYGLGFRVGEPTTIRYEGVPDLVAVLNAPPTHYDILEGEEVIVNRQTFSGSGSFTSLSNIEGITSSFEITREKASATTSTNGFQLNARVAVVFGNVDLAWQDFTSNTENTGYANLEQIAVSRDLVASGDDAVLYISTDKDVWKYPIIDQSGNQVGSLDIVLSSSCGERCVQKGDGRDLWWFTPDHEPFNILSYSSRAPKDFNPVNRIMVGEKVTLGPNAHEQWVDQQSGRSQNKVSLDHKASRTGKGGSAGGSVSVDYTFSGAFMGVGPQIKMPLGVAVTSGYVGRTETSSEDLDAQTKSASISREVSVHSYLEAIAPQYAYKVQPYVYMARTGSGQEYLKVDYSAEPGYYPGVSTWWQRTYNKPDPTFNMPWWWTTFKRDRTMLTKEIVSTPLFPRLGEVVQVTVTVRNKALVSAQDVSLALWRGSPDNCLDLTCLFIGRTLIGATKVNIVPAQGQRDVSFLFKYDGTNNIHATLDDNGEIDEKHEDNNEAYSLMFYNLRDEGYTLQTIRLDKTLTLTPVRTGPGRRWIRGYDIAATVLGDTYTRQNVLVQFWHGQVGGAGRLISTVNVPRVRGSVSTTTQFALSVFWDTSNPNLYGRQELHAVILHSGFDTTPDNVISHVHQSVSVGCYGDVDVCGVCGGDNKACMGCDGVPLSGKTVDMCGKCGGGGSTCCIRKPSQASVHYLRLRVSDYGTTKRVKVGDMVVWENLLDWNVQIEGGVFDHVGAPAFELSTLKFKGFGIQSAVPLMTLDEETVNAYVQQYLSMVTMNDHIESSASRPYVAPDRLSQFLRRSTAAAGADQPSADLPDDFDNLGLARFPGWHVDIPTVSLSESRLRNVARRSRATSAPRNGYTAGDDGVEVQEMYEYDDHYDDYDDDDDGDVYEAMEGVCCAEPEFGDDDGGTRQRKRASSLGHGNTELDKHLAAVLEKRRHSRPVQVSKEEEESDDDRLSRIPSPVFSLRAVALSLLMHQKEQADYLSLVNDTAIEMDHYVLGERKREASRSFYDAARHEAESEAGYSGRHSRGGSPVHCLCPNSLRRRQTTPGDTGGTTTGGGTTPGGGTTTGGGTTPGGGAATGGGTTPSGGSTSGTTPGGGTSDGGGVTPNSAAADPAAAAAGDEGSAKGSAGSGALGRAEVTISATLLGTTSYGVSVFSGFGPARKWALYDFGGITRAATADSSILPPGGASAPHRFFSPGIYVWHDSNNPAIHGTIIVDPSDLVMDACGVCGGNGTTCLDCKRTPYGNARRDVCGVCYDPLVDSYDADRAKDCAGVCNGTAVVDECGYCVGGSTGRVAGFARDCAGVCNGATPSLCGVCGATEATRPDLLDCAGECFGLRVVNPCGHCVGGTSGLDLSHGIDCAGVCNGTAVRDCFNRCQGTAKVDCAGVCNGTARINECQRCVGGSSGLDDAMTKTCAGICAITPAQVCGSRNTTKRAADHNDDHDDHDAELTTTMTTVMLGDIAERSSSPSGGCAGGVVDCEGVCNGTARADSRRTCCPAKALDCANLCRGSATTVCGRCVGGSSGIDVSEVRDCAGVCNGTARYNPCGVCVAPGTAAYYNGTGYRVDCAGVCNGSAYVDDCGKCVEGTTGRLPNVDKDCNEECFGSALMDNCGVCYKAGDNHTANADMDCAGVCGGAAVVDDCGQCALGTTMRERNADKDCAGQCFGQHIITDPACTCPAGELDLCYVCGGNNTQCAGCDGVPWSGRVRDLCGVCGGNNTACCFLPFAQTTATIRDFETIILRNSLETGETLAITNLHAGVAYSLIVDRLDVPPDVARVKQIQTRWDYAPLRPGNTLRLVLAEPGAYRVTSVESSSVSFALAVTYNAKALDPCGRCVYPPTSTDFFLALTATNSSNASNAAYGRCCAVMATGDVHGWYQTTFYHDDAGRPTRAVVTQRYKPAAAKHLVRLVAPHTFESRAWHSGGDGGGGGSAVIEVGDVLAFENADSVDHVLSFSGPQPVADLYLERGMIMRTPPFLKPGGYRVESNRNMVNASFSVAFRFACAIDAEEPRAAAADDTTLVVALVAGLGGGLVGLVVLAAVVAAVVVVVVLAKRRRATQNPFASPIDPGSTIAQKPVTIN